LSMSTWKSNPLVGLALLVVIFGAGWLVYRTVRKPGQMVEYSYVLKCTNPQCEEVFEGSYPKGEEPPFRCPRCGEKSAYILLQCRACGKTFTPLNNLYQRAPYLCPECGKRTGYPIEPGQIPLEATSSNP